MTSKPIVLQFSLKYGVVNWVERFSLEIFQMLTHFYAIQLDFID